MDLIDDVRKRYENKIVNVGGSRGRGPGGQNNQIFAFTLSTCMWCNLGKKWLNEKGYEYAYLDVDLLPVEDKNQLKAELREFAGEQLRYPFLMLIDKNKWHSGYDPSSWEDLLGE